MKRICLILAIILCCLVFFSSCNGGWLTGGGDNTEEPLVLTYNIDELLPHNVFKVYAGEQPPSMPSFLNGHMRLVGEFEENRDVTLRLYYGVRKGLYEAEREPFDYFDICYRTEDRQLISIAHRNFNPYDEGYFYSQVIGDCNDEYDYIAYNHWEEIVIPKEAVSVDKYDWGSTEEYWYNVGLRFIGNKEFDDMGNLYGDAMWTKKIIIEKEDNGSPLN